jgi:diaminopropionate ammonia-lyase
MLARPLARDPAVQAGPSGACGVAALAAVMQDAAMVPVREALALGPRSRVAAINTEGVTDPELYARLVG